MDGMKQTSYGGQNEKVQGKGIQRNMVHRADRNRSVRLAVLCRNGGAVSYG